VTRAFAAAVIAVGLVSIPAALAAEPPSQRSSAPPASRIQACSLLPAAEVKKHLPWRPQLDQFAPEEEPIGTIGSSCNYPTVFIQVLPFSQNMINIMREKGGLETLSGVGDEAYFHNNRDRYAEFFVRVGQRMLTLQANVDGNMPTVKAGSINLARALVARLR
jgi:hypothetical protein